MSMIFNKSKAVQVLKATGKPALRLFPGHNDTGKNDIKDYLKTPVNKALFEEHLEEVTASKMTSNEKKDAKKAKEKNTQLNKGKPDANPPGANKDKAPDKDKKD